MPVVHVANSQSSVEEARSLAEANGRLIGQSFRDRDGKKQLIGSSDILVVTPYNAQVNLLKQMLDKFQAQPFVDDHIVVEPRESGSPR